MRGAAVWMGMLAKRQLKRPVFVAILILIPLLCGILFRANRQEEQGVPVALACENPDDLTRAAMEQLCAQTGVFRFYTCGEEQLARDVAARRAECGYVFPEQLEERMREGTAADSIAAYSSPSSVAAQLSYEVVYAALFSQYAEGIFVDYIAENPLFAGKEPEALAREAREAYRTNRENGKIFSFVFERLTGDGGSQEVEGSSQSMSLTSSVRGMLTVFVLLGGLMGALDSLRDERRRAYLAAPPGLRRWIPLLAVAVPAALTALSAEAALLAGGLTRGLLQEWGLMAAYWLLVTGFCTLLADLLRREVLLCAAIPVLVMGCLLFSPVFLRLGSILPVFRMLEKLFVPTYYLNGVSGAWGGLLLAAGILLAASLLVRGLRKEC